MVVVEIYSANKRVVQQVLIYFLKSNLLLRIIFIIYIFFTKQEARLDMPAEVKEPFIEINQILEALKHKDLQPALRLVSMLMNLSYNPNPSPRTSCFYPIIKIKAIVEYHTCELCQVPCMGVSTESTVIKSNGFCISIKHL